MYVQNMMYVYVPFGANLSASVIATTIDGQEQGGGRACNEDEDGAFRSVGNRGYPETTADPATTTRTKTTNLFIFEQSLRGGPDASYGFQIMQTHDEQLTQLELTELVSKRDCTC